MYFFEVEKSKAQKKKEGMRLVYAELKDQIDYIDITLKINLKVAK